MKVAALVRTRNEAANIEAYCRAYVGFCDHVIVADGGSTDGTPDIAASVDPKVVVLSFEQIVARNGIARNPEGPHVNFLLDAAALLGMDWVILDDCDCLPNYLLREEGLAFVREADAAGQAVVMAVRLYLWGQDRHFPFLAKPNKERTWAPSLWAWRLSAGIKASEVDSWMLAFPDLSGLDALHLVPPYCLLHRPWPDEAAVKRKSDFYNGAGVPFHHPLEFGGPLEPLPEWAHA